MGQGELRGRWREAPEGVGGKVRNLPQSASLTAPSEREPRRGTEAAVTEVLNSCIQKEKTLKAWNSTALRVLNTIFMNYEL